MKPLLNGSVTMLRGSALLNWWLDWNIGCSIRVVVGCYCITAAGEEGTMTSLNGWKKINELGLVGEETSGGYDGGLILE